MLIAQLFAVFVLISNASSLPTSEDSEGKQGNLVDVVCHWQLGQAIATNKNDFKKLEPIHGKHPLTVCASKCKKSGANGAMVNLRTGRQCTCVKNMKGRNFKLENVVTGESDKPPRFASCKFGEVVTPDYTCNFQSGEGHSKEHSGVFGNTDLRLDLGSVASRDLCVQMCQERKVHWTKINAVTVTPSEGQCWCEIAMTTATPSTTSQYCKLS